MNVFDEFKHLVAELETQQVRYALVGGVALAFYSEPRFTQDIDLLVPAEDFEKMRGLLEKRGYFETGSPWTSKRVSIEFHRFLKVVGPEDEMIIDILIANDDQAKRIIPDALGADSEEGKVRVANKNDLIWLKRLRDSKQDQADIEKLENEKNR